MKKYMIFLSIFLLTAVSAFPLGRGGGGGGAGVRGGNGGNMDRGGSIQQRGGQMGGSQNENGEISRRQDRINSQQRKQLGECSKTADGIRKQARKMAQTSEKKFKAGEARQQSSRIQEQIRSMDMKHEKLMNGLDEGQKQTFREEIQNMTQLRQQIKTQMQEMNSDLSPNNPDAQKIREQARDMERTMSELRQQYNTLADQSE